VHFHKGNEELKLRWRSHRLWAIGFSIHGAEGKSRLGRSASGGNSSVFKKFPIEVDESLFRRYPAMYNLPSSL